MSQEAPLTPGIIIGAGRYRIERLVAQGGMGRVYAAHHLPLDQRVALKEMALANTADLQAAKTAQQLFLQEGRMLCRLRHPHLPIVFDAFSENNRLFLAMEFIEGETLAAIRARRGPIPEQEVRSWLEQLCDVLEYLHGQQPPIIFRDLKPANVMLQPDGIIKLIDFGIARLFKAEQTHDTTQLGTEGYSPPEQYGWGQTDARSDIYALGKLAWSLLTGQDPAREPGGIFHVRPAHMLVPPVSPTLDALIQYATALDPKQRPASTAEFRQLLHQPVYSSADPSQTQITLALASQPTGSPTLPHHPQRTGRLLFGSLVAILLLGSLLMLSVGHRLSPTSTNIMPIAQPPTATATATATVSPSPTHEAQATVQAYYNAINHRDYQGAYNLWGTSFRHTHPYQQFAIGYANTQQDIITIQAITPLSDGTFQVGITIQALQQTAIGTTTSLFQGFYIVGLENSAWKLLSANIHQIR
jgi:serine/threonine protein kinase